MGLFSKFFGKKEPAVPGKIRPHVEQLAKDFGFKVKKSVISASFGDFCVILGSDDFWVQMTSDRSQEFVELSYDKGDHWVFIGYMRNILYQDIPLKDCHIHSFDENSRFIEENYSAIKNLFSAENVASTKKILKQRYNVW